ncbi:hypothetical protein B5807_09092 [Epicoccum nigrum]|uniref:Heterokaryon incompatibility domain-containing protein n=1 Tax=Epicoccum nigrum TaxID=105696 RepID=A0A1Y2LNN8_EPING|nr:hypothetical protein B5807_09092 [Epicoccum nigrum]
MNGFIHEEIDLQGHSFRLLRLCKANFGTVRCELFHAHLDDDSIIEYEALSYTWEESHKPYNIVVNGRMMPVTRNLSMALRNLRYPHQDRILWIDAICIDQTNDKERGHQVGQMTAIYRKAEQVLVWLGLATPETNSIFDYMNRFEKESYRFACRNWKPSDERWRGIKYSLHSPEEDVKTALTADEYEGIEDLLSRSWFERVWVIQEVANARAARMMCGGKSVLAGTFALFPYLLDITPNQHCQAILDVMPGPTRKHSWWTRKHDLNTLLLRFKGSKASDPRDKIYALLGIASDRSTTNFPSPEYEKTEVEVVQDITNFLIGTQIGQKETPYLPHWTLEEFLQRLEHLFDSACIQAAIRGDTATVGSLLDAGKADPNFKNEEDMTPLLLAAEKGHELIVRRLLNTIDVDVNFKNKKGQTALSLAAKNGHWHIFNLLRKRDVLEEGRHDMKIQNGHDQTPLIPAAQKGEEEGILDTQIVDAELKDAPGWSPLRSSAITGQRAIADTLREVQQAGAPTSAHRDVLKTETEFIDKRLINHKLHGLGRSQRQLAPLAIAAQCFDDTFFQLLLGVLAVDTGKTYIHEQLLIVWAAKHHRTTTVKMVLDTIKADITLQDTWAWDLLQSAVLDQDRLTISLLLATGQAGAVFKSHANRAGHKMLEEAINKRDEAIIDELLSSEKIGSPVASADDVESLVRSLEEYYASASAV